MSLFTRKSMRNFKKTIAIVFIISAIVQSFSGLAFAEEGDTVVYDFRNVGLDGQPGTPAGFELDGALSTVVPRVVKATFGVSLQTNPNSTSALKRSFKLPVAK